MDPSLSIHSITTFIPYLYLKPHTQHSRHIHSIQNKMPPKSAAVVASPSPPPASPNDTQDILVIADMIDTFDQLPSELTRVHSDLNELAAVLYGKLYCLLDSICGMARTDWSATLVTLESKLNQLVEWIQDPSIGPEQRFQLLQEIAEEAARYKLGGDDKIRVAGGACDGVSLLPLRLFK